MVPVPASPRAAAVDLVFSNPPSLGPESGHCSLLGDSTTLHYTLDNLDIIHLNFVN